MASEDTGSADGSLTIGDIVQGQNVVNAHLLRLHVEQCEYVDGDDEGMARRDIFACLTCFKKTGKHAGICRPCSIRCHADHDLVELGRKYFKCDCGNQGRLGGVECQMVAGVRHDNPHNRYNHNFEGRFCSCDRPYAASETMYQCFGCEDWFHESHIPGGVPRSDFAAFFCQSCVTGSLQFLSQYTDACLWPPQSSATPTRDDPPPAGSGSVGSGGVSGAADAGAGGASGCCTSSGSGGAAGNGSGASASTNSGISGDASGDTKGGAGAAQPAAGAPSVPAPGTPASPGVVPLCLTLATRRGQLNAPKATSPLFFPAGWHELLCTCRTCTRAYAAANVPYVTQAVEEDPDEETQATAIAQQIDATQVVEQVALGMMAAARGAAGGREAAARMGGALQALREQLFPMLRERQQAGAEVTREDIQRVLRGAPPDNDGNNDDNDNDDNDNDGDDGDDGDDNPRPAKRSRP